MDQLSLSKFSLSVLGLWLRGGKSNLTSLTINIFFMTYCYDQLKDEKYTHINYNFKA